VTKIKFTVPSAGTILGFIAVLISLGGVAYAAGALVTIADPVTNAKARVLANGALEVWVNGQTLNTQLAPPARIFHSPFAQLNNGSGCVALATPPAGSALIIQQVRVNTFANPTPGASNVVILVVGPTCAAGSISSVNPPGFGLTTITFGAGLAVPQGSKLWAAVGGGIAAEIYSDGITVPAAQVPTDAVALGPSGPVRQQTQNMVRR